MKVIDKIALLLVIIGAINWLLVGIFNYNLVGISGLWCIKALFEEK